MPWRAEVEQRVIRHGAGYRLWAIATLMIGTFVAVMEGTIVNVAMPEIERAFGVGHNVTQFLATGFLAATTVSMLSAPWALARFGLRRSYSVAIGAFLVASVTAMTLGRHSFAILVLARITQGIGAGLIQPIAMVALLPLFPPGAQGVAMSAYGLGIVLAPAIGPVVGGFLVDAYGWPVVFLIAVPFCLVALGGARFILFEGAASGAARRLPDVAGLLLLSVALCALLAGASHVMQGGVWPALLLGGLALAGVFVRRQWHAASPLLDLRRLRRRGLREAVLVSLVYGAGLYGSTYLVPLFAQQVLGATAYQAGLLLLPGGAVLALTLRLAGRLADAYPPRRLVLTGLACFAASCLLLAGSGPALRLIWVCVWIALGRIGLGLLIPSLNAGAMRAAEAEQLPAVIAAMNFTRQLGGALGIVSLSVLLESWHAATRLSAGFTLSFGIVACIFAVAAWPAARMQGRLGR